jgi:ubiquinone/menaquinone biosynthesis C-methylase UbiE
MAMNLFKDAAEYYKYRPEYPQEIIDLIVSKTGADSSRNLLDIGSGTGSLCIPLSPFYKDVFAVDIDADMIEQGKKNAAMKHVDNISWVQGDAMKLDKEFVNVQTVSFGCSLHWFDGPTLLKKCHELLLDDGTVVITGIYTIWKSTPQAWQQKMLEIIKKYLGPTRLTLQGQYSNAGKPRGTTNKFIDFLERAGFVRNEVIEFELADRILNIDEIIGHQYSMSYAAPSLFKERRLDFENELKSELLKMNPENRFVEPNSGFVTFGWKK